MTSRSILCRVGVTVVVVVLASTLQACRTGPEIDVTTPLPAAVPQFPRHVDAVVRVTTSNGLTIPADYQGFSFEASAMCGLLRLDNRHRARFERLFRNLGPGVIHVGGRSTDLARWVPNGRASCSHAEPVITTNEIRTIFHLARRVGWKVLWELPLAHFDPAKDAAEASAIASIAGNRLLGWTIGNEPDLYYRFWSRPLSWGYVNFFHQWNRTRIAVQHAVPTSRFVGPETCCNYLDFGSFAGDARDMVSALSLHYYAGSTPSNPVAYLLSRVPDQKLAQLSANAWHASARIDHMPLYVTETNTLPAGGKRGVSDTFAAGLWLVDFLFDALKLHISQADVQQSAPGAHIYYNPISRGGRPNPLYYGMLFFHNAVPPGSRFLNAHLTTSANVTAYAVGLPNDGLNVVVVNKSARRKTVEVHLGVDYQTVGVIRLAAISLAAKDSGITLGGRHVSARGTWRPRLTRFPLHGRSVTVNVPADSAAAIEFRGKRG